MRDILLSIFDAILIIAGSIIIIYGFMEWQETGFDLTMRGATRNDKANESLIIMLLGLGSFCYGIIDLMMFRKGTQKEVMSK